MPRPSQKHGPSGVSNAAHSPYRLVGGDHHHPRFFQPEMIMAQKLSPSDYHQTATYANGVLGGILAKLHFGQQLSDFEKQLIGRK